MTVTDTITNQATKRPIPGFAEATTGDRAVLCMPGESEPTGQEQVTPFFYAAAGVKQADIWLYWQGNAVKMWDTRQNPILLLKLGGAGLLQIAKCTFLHMYAVIRVYFGSPLKQSTRHVVTGSAAWQQRQAAATL